MRWFFTIFMTVWALGLALPAHAQIDSILSAKEAPAGVVFEVVQGDQSALSWALPKIDRYTKQIKAKFPDVSISVVTHGNEQFGLIEGFDGPQASIIRRKALQMTQAGTELHVCGGHAKARGVTASAFPQHINVAPSGPAQVQALRDQGYVLVQIRNR